eukprot:287429_1
MAFTFVFVAFIAFFSYLFCNRIRSICPSLSSCQDLPKRRENSIPLQRHSAIRFSQPNDSPVATVTANNSVTRNKNRKQSTPQVRDKSNSKQNGVGCDLSCECKL